jgi:23S rRNA (uracil-5-)-methyltransferase RumA
MLAVKKSFAKDQLLINLVTSSSELDRFDQKAFVDLILAAFPDRIGGILHTVNDDPGDRPEANQGEQHLLYGQAFLVEKIAGLSFRISPESFFQTNPAAAEKLYDKALNYVFEKEIAPRSIVLDLFSGTGTISQLLAQRAKGNKIIGVEIVASAVEDAKRNAQLNGLDRLEFFNADVGKFLLERPEFKDHIDSVVLDPPRAGIAPKTLRKVISLSAKRIIYISCNPATQARDIQILVEAGYDLKKFSLVDQFPHTAHIESVALFEKREGSTKTAIDSVKKSTNI